MAKSTWKDAAASAAKSLQSCLTLCDPMDCNPTGSPIPGILQARTLEWVAISFSNAWKMLNIINYWRNVNQNYNEVSPHSKQNGHHQKKKKSTNNKYCRDCVEKGTLLHCWWECKLVQLLRRTVQWFLLKLKTELAYDPPIPLLSIFWTEL